jgi:uncharacterized membrane protein YdbT with pleckstrin-like domain
MKCPECGAEAIPDSRFCHQCGVALNAAERHQQGEDSPAMRLYQPGRSDAGSGTPNEEIELWRGSFSAKGMINAWILAGLATIAWLVLGALLPARTEWLLSGGLVALFWLGLLLVLLYRKLNVHYRLTNQRLIHKAGILRRVTDRIEIIDMDDISCNQNIFERLLGVGSIQVTSSDRTHPHIILRGVDNVQEVATIMDDARRQERKKRGLHIEAV